jgi:uncharacterized membrane protein
MPSRSRYNHTIGQVLESLENTHMDLLHQARLFAIESDLHVDVEIAMLTDMPFYITEELLYTCTDLNVQRCLRSANNILICINILGQHYRSSPEANVGEN